MDPISKKCFMFAINSKSDVMRFGAFVEKNGEIIGGGCNRRPTKEERKQASKILGANLDYCIHAEETAAISAYKNTRDLSGAILYVLGFSKDNKPFMRKKPFFTCPRCAKRVLLRFNLPVRVRTVHGWKQLSPRKAYQISLNFKNSRFWEKTAKQSINKGDKNEKNIFDLSSQSGRQKNP